MFTKKDRKLITELKTKFDELSKATINKAKRYDEIQGWLKAIKFSISKCTPIFDESIMAYVAKIKYDIPEVTIVLDEHGEPIDNALLSAINWLNLISFDDMDRITNVINQINTLNKGGT